MSYLHGCDVIVGGSSMQERATTRSTETLYVTAIVFGALASVATIIQFVIFLKERSR